MYASDAIYSTDKTCYDEYFNELPTVFNKRCVDKSWMNFSDRAWAISQTSTAPTSPYRATTIIGILPNIMPTVNPQLALMNSVDKEYLVYPTLTLEKNVKITSRIGTSSDPYQLSL